MSDNPPSPKGTGAAKDLLTAPIGADGPIHDKDSVRVIQSAPGEKQGVALPNSERPGYSAVYRNAASPDKLIQSSHPLVRTQYDAFEYSVKKYPDRDLLGARFLVDPQRGLWSPYIWQSYRTVAERRTNLGSGLCHLNDHVIKNPTTEQYAIALFSQNRPEWILTDLACHAYNLIVVPLYDNLGPNSSEFILNAVEAPILVASLNHIPKILSLTNDLPNLKVIISMDPLKSDSDLPDQSKEDILKAWAKDRSVMIYTMTEVEELGKQHLRPHNPPNPSDILTINYTSGTTSSPKGVVLTHANFVAAIAVAFCHLPRSSNDVVDVVLSYLPLAHIYERATIGIALAVGAAVAFYRGNILQILEDLLEVRPTAFTSVPRLLNRFESAIKDKTVNAVGWRSSIARHGLSVKLQSLADGHGPNKFIWDRLISKKVRANAGMDRVACIVSGSAPLAPDSHQFLRAAFAVPISQGYGLTETHGGCLVGQAADFTTGHCGPPTVTTEVCLKDVPELDYYVTDKPWPRGELLIRGTSVFREYYKDKARTREAIDADGWFHTGDVAAIDELGRVYIIDRAKNFFKLAQGEYVAPEKIENAYLAGCPLVQQLFIHGNSLEAYLVAIGGVQPLAFAPFVSKILDRHISPSDEAALQEACEDPRVIEVVLAEFEKVAKDMNLQGYEKVRNLKLMVEPFTIENDILTPTLKLKRPVAAAFFKDVIQEMYKQGDMTKKLRT
ncbi:eukaryotic long-chain fatty acid CoA synthetase (LC-FACS) [Lipomyces tetrasporus]|uniref:Eukaryotic long-chain fatty acid CoA synthetase (LC-FACS) n=1 Tax=Lipomyces tetrasporus TaxID=54092 RepID=A0AAD7QQ41_9ASCO|nr:eukaryotic long-chain fatty acid CoA synthetase (LC-FACS) [Lipomyces tetrasporus]KAJ8099418.1 eukaryotic long-chain fatty acid CoA synthetase (LC-FACS) [Lipomyces tetrasporus]